MEYLIQRKLPDDYSYPIVDVFNKLTITGKYNLVGSSSLKSILYNSDYDLNEIVKANGIGALRHIAELFQRKFEEAKRNPNVFILDFKCGEVAGKPLRWNYTDIMRGEKPVAGKPAVPLFMALSQKSTIKLDMVVLIQGVFTEFSEIYFININGRTNQEPYLGKEKTQEALMDEYDEFHADGNYWKALKRLFSIYRFDPSKYRKHIKNMVHFFDGQVGLLHKNKNELDIILNVMEGEKKPNRKDIYNNLQIVKQSVSNVFSIPLKKNISNTINHLCSISSFSVLKKEITAMRNYFERIINTESLAFLNTSLKK